MEYLWSGAGRKRLTQFAASKVLLAFDLDGTLAPIAGNPDRVAVPPRTRALLRNLARLYPCAVVSSRSEEDLRGRVAGLADKVTVASYSVVDRGRAAQTHVRIDAWDRLLRERLAGHSGVRIEKKRTGMSIHYRQSNRKRVVLRTIKGMLPLLEGARRIDGKQVVHLLEEWAPDKGMCVDRLRTRLKCDTILYVGDDETDEGVFALAHAGEILAIRIGRNTASQARFYLRSRSEVDRLLRELVAFRSGNAAVSGVLAPASKAPKQIAAADFPPQQAPVRDVLEFLPLLWAVDHDIQTVSKGMAKRLGVTGPQRMVVRISGRFPGLTAGKLAQILHVHPSTLTGILARLDRAGIIERRPDPRDRRIVQIGLTPIGRALNVRTQGTVEDAVQRALAVMDPRDVQATRTFMTTLRRELQAIAGAPETARRGDPQR